MYDTLRSADPQVFGCYFGKSIFEGYVGRVAAHSKLPVLREKELKDALGSGCKVIDYLIVDDDVHIFIDAKAVEMTYVGEVTEDPEQILQRIESSVIKGIEQAYSVAERLVGISRIGTISLGEPTERYLLIVTYKDLYLGCGRDFYEFLAKDILDQTVRKFSNIRWIPFEHMYFVSIEDFEFLVEAVHEGRTGIASFLRGAVRSDCALPVGRGKLVICQHLHELVGPLKPPAYLKEEFEDLRRRVMSKFSLDG